MPEKVILYGTGLEGEKFYCRYKPKLEIVYCLDKRKRNDFHGKSVFTLDEKKEDVKKYFVVVTVSHIIYKHLKLKLEKIGLREYKDFIHGDAIGKKLVFMYGNCHMSALGRYLSLNYGFSSRYYICQYNITQDNAPQGSELEYCDVLITQDIREDNYLGKTSAQVLIDRHAIGKNILVPNLYGYNLFFPQVEFGNSQDYQQKRWERVGCHLGKDAIDLDTLEENGKITAHDFAYMMMGYGDAYIDEMYHKGATVEMIKKDILDKQIWSEIEIKDNFDKVLKKIKEREENCDFKIADFIEKNFQKYRLFYNPRHPAESITEAKGDKILELLDIIPERDGLFESGLGKDEMPIYGCVEKALGLKFQQKYYRTISGWTLANQKESLEDYIKNYIAWVWE